MRITCFRFVWLLSVSFEQVQSNFGNKVHIFIQPWLDIYEYNFKCRPAIYVDQCSLL